jgi:hypothetical protein
MNFEMKTEMSRNKKEREKEEVIKRVEVGGMIA